MCVLCVGPCVSTTVRPEGHTVSTLQSGRGTTLFQREPSTHSLVWEGSRIAVHTADAFAVTRIHRAGLWGPNKRRHLEYERLCHPRRYLEWDETLPRRVPTETTTVCIHKSICHETNTTLSSLEKGFELTCPRAIHMGVQRARDRSRKVQDILAVIAVCLHLHGNTI